MGIGANALTYSAVHWLLMTEMGAGAPQEGPWRRVEASGGELEHYPLTPPPGVSPWP